MSLSEGFEMITGFVRAYEAARLLGVNPVTVRRWSKTGQMPAAMKLSGRCVGWPKEVFEAFLESRIEKVEPQK
jgi:excisionase family DNA binding protein